MMGKKSAQRARMMNNSVKIEEEKIDQEGIVVGRRESASLFLFKNEEMIEETTQRMENIQKAKDLADAEQQRRIDEEKSRQEEVEIVRKMNIAYSISAADEEKERRIHEYEVAKVQEQLLREHNKATATLAAETERQRRLSDEYPTKCVVSHEEEEEILFSDIPVGSNGKMIVDETSKWRCYIQSESPDQEQDHLRALRMSLELELKDSPCYPELIGDVRLLRFLRGSKQNVAIAASKYREMLLLRQQYNLNEIRNTIVSQSMTSIDFPGYNKIIQHLPFLHTYDVSTSVDNHVFCFEMTGYADTRGLVENITDEEWMSYWLYHMEYVAMKLDQLSRQHEKLIQMISVRDFTGFSITRFHPRVLKRLYSLLTIATTCYPETIYETLFLNTPWVFNQVWNRILPRVHETQLRKIHMSQDAYAHLVDLVGGTRDALPKQLGGKNILQIIPQTGFLGNNAYVLLCDDGAIQADIKAGGILQLPFRICANDTVCWEYVIKGHDLEFSVKLRVQGDGGAVEIDKISKTRVGAENIITGSYTATEEGTVVLSWDNSYSWTRSKSVAYKAKVVKATHDFSCLDISGNDCV